MATGWFPSALAGPDANVVVTGAPTYDQWFTRRPSTTRSEFCRKVGLPAERPFVLYLCSSKFIAPREADYIKRWIQALRAAADPRVRDAAVLVRPHPRGDMRGLDEPELRGLNGGVGMYGPPRIRLQAML